MDIGQNSLEMWSLDWGWCYIHIQRYDDEFLFWSVFPINSNSVMGVCIEERDDETVSLSLSFPSQHRELFGGVKRLVAIFK